MQAILARNPIVVLQSLSPEEWKLGYSVLEEAAKWVFMIAATAAGRYIVRTVRAIRPGIAADVMVLASAQIDEKLTAQWAAHESKSADRFSKIDATLQSVMATQTKQGASLTALDAHLVKLDSHKTDQISEFKRLREELERHYPKLASRHNPVQA